MTTVVVVPFRSDGGHRERLWRRLRDTFWRSRFPVVIGNHDGDGPFNRSAAINAAAGECSWSTLVVADADTWVDLSQLREAIGLAKVSGRLVAAFDSVVELDRSTTEAIVCGDLSLADVDVFSHEQIRTAELETQSSMLVVPRRLWDLVKFDTRFRGWGGEDNAYWRSCAIVAGEPYRVSGPAFHLWHPPAEGKHSGSNYQMNLRLWRRYQQASTLEQLRDIQTGKGLRRAESLPRSE